MTAVRPVPPNLTPLPLPTTENETALWDNQRKIAAWASAMNQYLGTLENETKKSAATDLSGTVNSGDSGTDDVIEAMRTAMVLNLLGRVT